MRQPSARPSFTVHSIAVRFGTGNEPGMARQTGHVRVFGGSPQTFSQRQNIFVRVFSWTWISSPITGCQLTLRGPFGRLPGSVHVIAGCSGPDGSGPYRRLR